MSRAAVTGLFAIGTAAAIAELYLLAGIFHIIAGGVS